MNEAHVAFDSTRTKEDMRLTNQRLEELEAEYEALNSGELQRHSC